MAENNKVVEAWESLNWVRYDFEGKDSIRMDEERKEMIIKSLKKKRFGAYGAKWMASEIRSQRALEKALSKSRNQIQKLEISSLNQTNQSLVNANIRILSGDGTYSEKKLRSTVQIVRRSLVAMQ